MRRGDRVELRPPAEILGTLDEHAALDGVPLMPEMLQYFGRTFTVEAQVERACDTLGYTGVRRLPDTVILDDLRCDGSGHDGCQARCRLYWKEAWLRPAGATSMTAAEASADPAYAELERRAAANTHAAQSTPEQPLYRCQATELLRGSEPVDWWSLRSLLHELTGGNVPPWRFVRVMTRVVVEEIGRRLGLISRSGHPFPPRSGPAPQAPPPQGLREGQLVRVRSGPEIRETLDPRGKNRGLWFDREMKVYCGHTARVKAKVDHFIDETSGRMVDLSSDCYILDDVVCQSYRSDGRWFCPRAIYPWWREAWLETLEEAERPSENSSA